MTHPGIGRNTKALIAGGAEEICMRLQHELKKKGCEVEYITSPLGVIERLHDARGEEKPYELLLLDLRMQIASGFELLKEIRGAQPDLDIIITGYGDEDKAVEAIRLGASDYLHKPISLEDLNTALFRIQQKKAVEEGTKALRENEKKFRSICAAAQDAIIMMDNEGNISYWNEAAEQIFGYSSQEALGQEVHILLAPMRYHEAYRGGFSRFKATGQGPAVGKTLELAAVKKDGTEFPIELSVSGVNLEGKWSAIGILRDITGRKQAEERLLKVKTELEEMNRRLQENQAQLVQSEKMASIGQLAAGVAHEINNPVAFINSNLTTLDEYRRDLTELIDSYLHLGELAARNPAVSNDSDVADTLEAIRTLKEKIDLEFILDDFDKIISESREGTERVKKIVKDLKDLSHVDQAELKYTDLNKGLDSTLNIVWNEIKYKATVKKDYGDIPEVCCYPQQVNQVFMNILVNAAQAIEDKGEIRISTQFLDADRPMVEIRISDTGKGIPPENLRKIFDPFFTTKPVGKGTGLGLNVSYNIVKKHQGEIKVESEVGKGTTFVIRLPVEGPKEA